MTRTELIQKIFERKSCLCVGLDPDLEKLPVQFDRRSASLFPFVKEIIDATKDLCVAYKINTAFFEAYGSAGWKALEACIKYIPSSHFIIADAKRGDIGNTSSRYAKAFFETLQCNAVTIAPYMGRDSIEPFLQFDDKWSIVLALTSNEGSNDFQQKIIGGKPLWKLVLEETSKYSTPQNMMYVVGATRASLIKEVRKIVPEHFLLIPGVGAQGGTVKEVMENGMIKDCGLLINVSRGILYASNEKDFSEHARNAAIKYQTEMKDYL